MQYKSLLSVLFTCYVFMAFGQNQEKTNFWSSSSDLAYKNSIYQREIVPSKYVTFDIDLEGFERHLRQALPSTSTILKSQNTRIQIPNPDGKLETYTIWRDDLLPEELNARYPEISVFAGYSEKDPLKTVRLDITSKGLRAICSGSEQGTYFIDPIARGVKNTVISYFKKDYSSRPEFECLVQDTKEVAIQKHTHDHGPQRIAGDCDLHIFELALACTGEYATFHGGNKNDVMAEYTTSINRVNELFENEVGVRFVFIPNTDDLIFLNAGTDPYTNNDGIAMLGENQTTCDNIIGSANYDIGHVYSTGGGGVARLNSPCNNNTKAEGVTGLGSPVGDPFYVDYVAHEIGHQFGATHTYNNSCGGNRTGSTAFEPGSGATILAYAGICPPNVQFASDSYFHSSSLVQIGNFLSSTSCEDIVDDGSDRPLIAPLQNYNIPISTPFELTANASISDGSALTYCWEQMDNEVANMPPEANSAVGPMFRSYTPVVNPSRVFPSFPFLLSNNDNEWEVLPGTTRELNFRITVRATGGGQAGCTEESDLVLNVSNTSGPFLVLSPNANDTWTVGETQPIVWDVANTTDAPVNCQNVNILMSTDGGFTYPISLIENTPNDGLENIMVPNFPGNEVRIRVQAVDNVFFDISNQNLTIVEPAVPTFTLSSPDSEKSVCGSNTNTVSYEIESTSLAGFNDQVEYTVSGLPSGISGNFDNNNSVPNATAVLNLSGLNNLNSGIYSFTVQGNGGGQSDEIEFTLTLTDGPPSASNLLLPENTADGVSTTVALNWTTGIFSDEYTVEVSDDANFENIVFSNTLEENNTNPTGLTTTTVYYWRVRSFNICGEGSISQVYRFRTGGQACTTYNNTTSTTIPIANAGTINSIINVPNGSFVESVNLSLEILHSWIGDLDCNLTSPDNTNISIFDRPEFPFSQFGCDRDNIRATFDDTADNTAVDFEESCGNGVYAIDGTYQPIDPLNNFLGDNSAGNWNLEITDNVNEDGGSLENWSLEICTNAVTSILPTQVNNNILSVVRSNSETIQEVDLSFDGVGITDFVKYTLITLPAEGVLLKNSIALQQGESFTQTEINNNEISYSHSGSAAMTDNFIFDVEETNGGWVPNNTFQIEIIDVGLSAVAVLNTTITCFNGNDGSISVNVDGGTAPYTYSLDGINFQASNIFEGLAADTYTITVMDSDNNSTSTNSVVLDQPAQIIITPTVDRNSVSLSVSGGAGNLQYSLDNNNYQSSNEFDNLANGDYTIYVRDENDCIAEVMISINYEALSISVALVSPLLCHDDMNGIVEVIVNTGIGPFQYAIENNPFQNSNRFENLGAGTYTFIVQDSFGDEVGTQLTIANPDLLVASVNPDQGTASIVATGGTPPYTYSIDNGNFQNDPVFTNLAEGDYQANVRDANGCETSTSFTININNLTAFASQIREILCAGDAIASFSITASGGAEPYSYSLDGINFQSENIFSNMAAGQYTITIIDADQFQTTTNIVINEPDILDLNASAFRNDITLSASGGTAPYEYRLAGSDFQDNNVFENLDTGLTTFEVRDANGCIVSTSIMITYQRLSVEGETLNELSCAGDMDAAIMAIASGGSGPYTYSINGGPEQSSPTFNNLGSGEYVITIFEGTQNSTVSSSIIIEEPAIITIEVDTNEDMATINATGGTGNLSYSIDGQNYQTSNTFSNLANGQYNAYVRDENDCVQIDNFLISLTEIIVTAAVSLPITCFGESDGAIVVETSGGTNPKEYSLDGSNYQSDSFFGGLPAGEYTITVRDANGIITVSNIVVLENPNPISAALSIEQNNLSVDAMGGTGTFSYSIDGTNYQDSNVFNQLASGEYTLYIQDRNECLYTTEFTIDYIELSATAEIIRENLCAGDMNAIISINAEGGEAPYQYAIDGGAFQTDNQFSNLSAGSYDIVIEDANGSTFTINNVLITDPAPINATSQINGSSVSLAAQGGTMPYSYSLDNTIYQNDNTFENLENGDYIGYVQDANGCIATAEFSINVIQPLSLTLEVEELLDCTGETAGSITATGMGGTPPYLYQLNEGPFTSDNVFTDLPPGQIRITVQDALMNTVSSLALLTAPDPMVIQIEIENNNAEIIVTGGAPPYSYSLDAGQSFADSRFFNDLDIGDYEILVEDANGCTTTQIFSINSVSVTPIDHSLILDLAPNPASQTTYLNIGDQAYDKLSISLIDILGRTVRTFDQINTTGTNQFDLDLSNIVSGTYLVRLELDGKVAVRKLIVE